MMADSSRPVFLAMRQMLAQLATRMSHHRIVTKYHRILMQAQLARHVVKEYGTVAVQRRHQVKVTLTLIT